MDDGQMSRRDYLKLLGAGAAVTTLPLADARAQSNPPPVPQESAEVKADRERRMRWRYEAKFGMFIHWGLYSVLGRHEWVQEMEGTPADEDARLAKEFRPKPNAAREWAQLAKRAGQGS